MSKNNKAALIYGSDTGSTEYISEIIAEKLALENLDFKDVVTMKPPDFAEYDIMIMGIPTWYIGELQTDWDDFFEEFKTIDFTGKKVAFYGLGDQYGYPDNFQDGLGILAEVVLDNGGELYGYWPNEGYDFNESLGVAPNGMFYGLALDEDNQRDESNDRIEKWVNQIKEELQF
tara:strand:- start:1910 stop:2431 length:522 start_codon:yes stop_codon:yes gene_type:complete